MENPPWNPGFWVEVPSCHGGSFWMFQVAYIMYIWGFTKKPVLSITSSGEIGIWEHDIEVSKMQGRARGRKGEGKTYHINPYHHITMEFGGYLLNVAKNLTRARARKGEAQGVLSYQKATGIFDNPHIYIYIYRCIGKEKRGPSNSGKMEVTLYLYIGWDNPSQVHRTKWRFTSGSVISHPGGDQTNQCVLETVEACVEVPNSLTARQMRVVRFYVGLISPSSSSLLPDNS